MTREQRADALLAWSRYWQNPGRRRPTVHIPEWIFDETEDSVGADEWASGANSGVGHEDLGFDIKGAEVWDREAKIWRGQ
jgi:hypothetical protein